MALKEKRTKPARNLEDLKTIERLRKQKDEAVRLLTLLYNAVERHDPIDMYNVGLQVKKFIGSTQA